MNEIQKGTTLKKVEQVKKPKKYLSGLQGTLQRALLAKRKDIEDDDEEDEINPALAVINSQLEELEKQMEEEEEW